MTGTGYSSTGDDENALRVDGAAVTLDGVTVDKRAGATSNTEDGDFYGMNAALLATNGATVTIKKTRLSIPPRRTATAYSATAAARPSTSPIPRSRQALITPAASRPPAAARRTRKT